MIFNQQYKLIETRVKMIKHSCIIDLKKLKSFDPNKLTSFNKIVQIGQFPTNFSI
jgi:hypothetical protein